MARWSSDWAAQAERRSRCVSLEAQIKRDLSDLTGLRREKQELERNIPALKREVDALKTQLSRLNLPFTLPKPKSRGALLRDLLKDSAAEIAVALQKERLEDQLRARERELAAAERRLMHLPFQILNQEGVLSDAERLHRQWRCLDT